MNKYLYLAVLYLLASCANPNKLHKMMDKLPDATAKECDERYPIRETIQTITEVDTALLHQYEVEFNYMALLIDSLLSANCDTVHIDKIKEVIKKIPCKPETKIIIKTQESTAKLEVLKNDCDKTIKSLSQINTQNVTKIHDLELTNGKLKARNNWMWVVIICLTIFAFRRQIAKTII
jgi:hypothetical protein